MCISATKNLEKRILTSTKIKNEEDLKNIKTLIENAIWKDSRGKINYGSIDLCEFCGTPFHINTVNIIDGPVSLFKDLEKIDIEECTNEAENDYKCMFCKT